MADPTTRTLHVSLPGAGNIQSYTLTQDVPVQFDFDLSSAEFVGKDGNLEIAVEGGGTIVLENYQALADSGSLPSFVMLGGEVVAGDVYLFAFEGGDQTAEDLETAAGANGSGSGAGEYTDDAGAMFDGLTALGGQGDAYDPHSLLTVAGVLGNIAPTANDDFAEITEQGDADFIVGRNIIFVDGEQDYQNALAQSEGGELPGMVGEFFPLSSGGGFYIYYPNPPQTPGLVEGNVIDNDVDVDGDHDLLRMVTIDHVGENHDGVDTDPVDVLADDTVIMGKYGVLVIDADGHWEYTLNQDWADVLNEGETYDEVFEYTIADGVGGESNTATLTITVNGSNDMPVAHDDLNVQAVETGDSGSYDLHASVYDEDLGEDGSLVNVHDEEGHDYHDASNLTVHGNVLAGDDAGGTTDTDVDGGDSPDGQTLFVVGVYSHATQTVDYDLPGEGNADFLPSEGQAYDVAQVDPNGEVSVNGMFGTLTIHADGSYDYELYTPEDGEAYDALNALNYNSEENVDQFTYGIMDDSGAFSYANISFTVNGANDAPVAFSDENSVVEFGIKNLGDEGYTGLVSGNVIAGDESGGVADTDVDDTRMFVSSVSSDNTEEGGALYTDENMDPNASVTIDGEYGTLTIHADGTYEYQLQNGWENVQALNEEDHPQDVFTYTVTNAYADGVYSNTATLTITVNGANDNPVAENDANSFTESVDDQAPAEVTGNVLAGDEFGGVADTDVDNAPSEFTVTGVESDNTENAAGSGDGYDFVLQGEYGTLYLNENGSYKYVENQGATNHLNIDDDPVTDVFTYTMTDNQAGHPGFSTATLTITIDGANDAPVARRDLNQFTESVDDEAAVSVSGNVIEGDEFGGRADYDVDNDRSELSVTAITYRGQEYTPDNDDDSDDSLITINGRWGTLTLDAETGEYTYTENQSATNKLNNDDTRTEVFRYTISDNQDGDPKEASANLKITITGANDAPVARVDTNAFTESVDDEAAVSVSGNVIEGDEFGGRADYDVDNARSELSVTSITYRGQEYTPDNDDDSDSSTITIDGKWGTLTLNTETGAYTYTEDPSATDKLNNDDTRTEVFRYTISDNQDGDPKEASANLRITITGANDAPVAENDANAFTESVDDQDAMEVTGNVLAGDESGGVADHDVDNALSEFTVTGVESENTDNSAAAADGYDYVIKGEYGTLYLNENGSYKYVEDQEATNGLNVGDDPVQDVFEYTMSDNQAGDAKGSTATLTITINGANDAPEPTDDIGVAKEAGFYTDGFDAHGNVIDGVLGVIGHDSDVDSDTLLVTHVDSNDAPGSAADVTGETAIAGEYGVLYIKPDGTYRYELNDNDDNVQKLNVNDVETDTFTYTITDEQGGTGQAELTIYVNGSDDAPVAVDDVKYNSIVEAGVDEPGDRFANGNVLNNDTDIDNAHSSLYVISAGAGAEGEGGNSVVWPWGTVITGTYGKLTIYNNGTYKYELNNNDSDTQALAEGEIAYDEFHYTVNDPLLANDTATLSIQIQGTNDAAVIGGDDTGTMTEDFQVVDGLLTADGTLTASDVDNTDNVFKAITEPVTDTHGGEFTMDASGNWHYEVSNASVQGMGTGEKYTSDFTVQSEDGTTHTVTVTVNGVNDAPVAENDALGNVSEGAGSAMSLGNVGDDNGNGADYDIDVNDSIVSYSAYGDLPAGVTLTPTGEVLFNANDPAYNNLAEGHSLTVTFQYVANDGEADSAPATVTFTVVGTNDGATIDTSSLGDSDTGSVTEIDWSNDDATKTDDFQASEESATAQYDQFGNLVVEAAPETLHAEGHLTVSDPDDHSVGTPVDTVDEATLAPAVTHNGTEYTGSFDANGDYSITTDEGGTFTIKADGSWSYDIDNTLDSVQELADNESFTETFTVESQDGTASHDVTVTVNGTNDAPVITNVSAPVEDFEDGASGWTDNTVTETTGAFSDFLGRFGNGDSTAKTFEVAEGADTATIEFDVYEIDSWTLSNNSSWGYDVLTFTVNGNDVDIPLERSLRDDDPIDNVDRSGTIHAADGTVIHWTFSAVTDGTQNLGFAGYEDQIHHVTITVENPGDTITLGLGSNLNEALNNESFGIDNVAVNSVDANGDVILTIDENVPGSVAVAQLESSDVEGQAVHYVIDQVLDADGNDVTADGLFIVDGDKILTADGVAFDHEASSKYTVTVSPVDSQGAVGQDVDITINIGDVNEPPTGEDFTMHVGLNGASVPFLGEDAVNPADDHVSDPEDDYQALDVMITDLPEHGTLIDGDGNPVEASDLNSTHYDLNELTYVPDSEAIDGVLLGSRNSGDASLSNWGTGSGDTRVMTLDTDGDGNTDVTITTTISEGALKQYAEPNASHIGHGIANADHNGLDAGETITVSFDGADVSYAEIGFSGLGGYFDPGSDQQAFATWAAYSDGVLVASGEVNNGMINGVATDGGSGGDIYQTMIIDADLLGEGVTFDQLVFGTVEHGDGDFANWELSYVDAEFANSDSFDYIPVDSEGLTDPDGPSTVTIDILPDAPVNQDPAAVDDSASVYEPNDLTPADTYADTVSANVLANDIDPDNTQGEMSLTTLTYEDSAGHETVIDFVNNTISVDGGPAETYSGSFQTEHGVMTIGADGDYTYKATDETLKTGDAPTETFTYTMTDGDTVDNDATAQTADLVITVNGLDDAPVDGNESVSVTEPDGVQNTAEIAEGNVLANTVDADNSADNPNNDTPSLSNLTYTDSDGHVTVVDFEQGTITVDGGPAAAYSGSFDTDYGTLEIDAQGNYTFTATNDALVDGYDPKEVITYTVTDEDGLTDTSTLTITVEGLNDAPVAQDDTFGTITEGSTGTAAGGLHLVGNVGANDSDVDTIGDATHAPDTLTFSAVDDLPAGVTMDAAGNVYFDATNPAYDHLGLNETQTLSFEYQVSDGKGGTSTATAELTVTGSNDAPTLDLSGGQVVFMGHEAGYHNMIGVYEMVDGMPVNPEIIMEDVQDATPGEVLATYGDGADLHYFLVDVEYGATPQGTPSFEWNETSGEWDIVFTDGQGNRTTYDVRFDNMDLNPNDSEPTFGDDPNHDYEMEVDDQLVDGYKTPGDDDDFDDVLADEQPGAPGPDNGPVVFTEGDGPVHVTGAVDISDVDSDNMSSITITYKPVEGDVLDMDTTGFTDKGLTDNGDGTVTWTISGDAPKGAYEAMLQSLTFENTLDDPLADDPNTPAVENLREYTITVYDDHGAASNTAVASVQVIPVNDGPDAVDDGSAAAPLTLDEDGSLFVNVLGNDTDPEGDALTITDFDKNVYDGDNNLIGTVAIGTDNQGHTGLVFTPVGDYNGPAQFNYTISDGELTDSATVTLQVNPTDDPVTAHDDGGAGELVNVYEDGTLTATGNVLTNDDAPDGWQTDAGGNVTAASFDNAVNGEVSGTYGTLTVGADGSYTYSLDNTAAQVLGDETYTEEFTYTAYDADGDSSTATLYITVNGQDDGVTARNDGGTGELINVYEDGTLTATGNVLTNDDAPDGWQTDAGGNVTAASFDNAVNGEVSGTYGTLTVGADGSYTYTLDNTAAQALGDETYTEEFTYTAYDADGDSNTATLYITVNGQDDGVTARNDGGTGELINVYEDGNLTASGNVLTNDDAPDGWQTDAGGNVTAAAFDGAVNGEVSGTYGTLAVGEDGSYTYTLNNAAAQALGDETFTEEFTYTAYDADGDSSTATLYITVNGQEDNTPPHAVNDTGAARINLVTTVHEADSFDFTGDSTPEGVTLQAYATKNSNNNTYKVDLTHGDNGVGISNDYEDKEDPNQIDGTGKRSEHLEVSFNESITGTFHVELGSVETNDTPGWIVYNGNNIVEGDWNRGDIVNGVATWTFTPDDSSATITRVWITAHDSSDDFTLLGITVGETSTTVDRIPVDGGVATGNVLANDFDAEDTDYVETGYPDGSTDLTVTGIAKGNLESGGELTQDNDSGSVMDGFNGHIGTDFNAGGETISGDYGTLVIEADGSYTYTPYSTLTEGSYTESFTYQVSDSGDAVDYGVINVTANVANANPHLIVGDASTPDGNSDDVITGSVGNDVLIGDTGGTVTLAETGSAEYVLVLDTSGSMGYNGVANLRTAVNNMVSALQDQLEGTGDADASVKITLIDFDTNIGTPTSFIVTADSVTAEGSNTTLASYLYTLQAEGSTNYEGALDAAVNYLEGADGDGEVQVIFMSDGSPNGTSLTDIDDGDNWWGSSSYPNTGWDDDVDQIGSLAAQLQALATVHAVGVGYNYDDTYLDQIDSGHDASSLSSSSGLSEFFVNLVNETSSLNAVGNDHVVGGDGNDIIFGDAVNTNGILDESIVSDLTHEGDSTTVSQATLDYVAAHHEQLGTETVLDGHGREGGNDVLFGGAGDDIIYGMEGNDNILISSGHDTVTLGSGADTITIDPNYLTDGDGTMTVTDFSLAEGDLFALDHLSGNVSVEVSVSGANNADLNLVFSDLDGHSDMTVILQGVNPDMSHVPSAPTDISSGDELNTLIQSIINSGSNSGS